MNFLLGGTYPVPPPTTVQDKGKDLLTFVNVASSHIMRTLQKPKKGRSKKRNVNHRRFLEKQLSKKYSTSVVTNDTLGNAAEISPAVEENEKSPELDGSEDNMATTPTQTVVCRNTNLSVSRQLSENPTSVVYKKQQPRHRALAPVSYSQSECLVRSPMQQHSSCVYKPSRQANTQLHANMGYYNPPTDNYYDIQRLSKASRSSSVASPTVSPMTTPSEMVYDVDISGPHFQEITDILTPIFSEERNCYGQDHTAENTSHGNSHMTAEYPTAREYVDSSPASSNLSYSTEQSSEFDYDMAQSTEQGCHQQNNTTEYTELSPCMYNDLSGWISHDSNLSNLYDLTVQLLEQQRELTCDSVTIAANIGT